MLPRVFGLVLLDLLLTGERLTLSVGSIHVRSMTFVTRILVGRTTTNLPTRQDLDAPGVVRLKGFL